MTDLRTLKAGSGTVATDIFNAVIDAILGGLRFTASNVDSGAATDGQVLTADGAGGASWEAGGGSQPGAAHWIGPYTVGFADFDENTYAAEIMTPTPGDLFLAGRFKIAAGQTFDAGTFLQFAAGVVGSVDSLLVTASTGSGGAEADSPTTGGVGTSQLFGAETSWVQDVDTKVVTPIYNGGVLIESDAVNPRVFLYTNQLPTQGSASVWLCFATPEAP